VDLGLRGRAAFVGGSSQGMGRAIAELFSGEGADVAMCARRAEELERAAVAVRTRGRRVVTRVADLADGPAAVAAVEGAVGELGRLDVLVVNSGGPPPGTFADLDDAAWHAAYELTLMSGVRMVRAALPALRKSDAAAVLFISSFTIRQPIANLVLSNSIRLAVAGLARSLANELAPKVRVNTVLPGNIRTERAVELARARSTAGRKVDDVIAEASRGIPLGRYGEVEDVARLAVFLCSPAASYISGAVVPCDGALIQAPV